MNKHYGTFDHTADVGLVAEADTPEEVFEALAEALADYICPQKLARPTQTRTVKVMAEDMEALALDFLSKVLEAVQVNRFMVAAVRVTSLTPFAVTAELSGEPFEAGRHEIRTEVKAVTYHLLKIANEDERWIGRVVLDL